MQRHEDAVRCTTEMEQVRNASLGFHARVQELERELRNERARFHTEIEQERQKVRDLESQLAALNSHVHLSPEPQPVSAQHVVDNNNPPHQNPSPVETVHQEHVTPSPQGGHGDQQPSTAASPANQQGDVHHQTAEQSSSPVPLEHAEVYHGEASPSQSDHVQSHEEIHANEPQHHTRNHRVHGRRRGSISMLEEHLGMEHQHENNENNGQNES